MKVDPHQNPVKLTTGNWTYLEQGMKRPLTGWSFWNTAMRLSKYRMANNLPRYSFDDAQMDLLCEKRKAMGRGCGPDAMPKPIPASELRAQQRKAILKPKHRCRSCGH